jgi:hypothetical protein
VPGDHDPRAADAEQVRLEADGGDLAFVDWREASVRVVFRGAIGFRWADQQEREDGVRDDLT